MHIGNVREMGRKIGITKTSGLRKAEIIRAIQLAEGNQDCFGSPWRFDCPYLDCCWRSDCLTKNPG